jgi:hypothetical protein
VFKESLLRVFKKFPAEAPMDGGHLQMGFAATLEVGPTNRHHEIDTSTTKETHPRIDVREHWQGLRVDNINLPILSALLPTPPPVHLLTPSLPFYAQVLTSREFKLSGAIGPCSSLHKAVRTPPPSPPSPKPPKNPFAFLSMNDVVSSSCLLI